VNVLKRFVKVLVVLAVINGVVQLVGRYVARRFAEGDEDSNEFAIAAIASGSDFRSRAVALREGRGWVLWGGAMIDLREARLDSNGAQLDLNATMGGIEVRVPPDWRVEMDTSGVALGGVDLKVRRDIELSDDAPTLRVRATARLGGIAVSSQHRPPKSGEQSWSPGGESNS
jgi:hypothetical protein